MNARHFLNSIKHEIDLNTDEELAKFLGASKASLDKWIQRDSIPDKWKYIIREKLQSEIHYPDHKYSVKNNDFYTINHTQMHIDLAQFDHKEEIEEIISLLPYAPGKFLEKIKEKLRTFEELSKI